MSIHEKSVAKFADSFDSADLTVDPSEIARFGSNATSGGRAAEARSWLVKYNPVRLKFLFETLGVRPGRHALAGRRILDVGCGTGIFAELLARHGAEVTGLDPAAGALAAARKSASAAGLDIFYTSDPLVRMRDQYDLVTAMEVIEHVPNAARFLAQCAARVAPGGHLAVSTINRTLKSFLYAIVVGEYVLACLPRGSHQWRRFVKPEEVEAELLGHGFRDFRRSGVTLNIRSGELRLSPDSGVNYLVAGRRASTSTTSSSDTWLKSS